MENQIIVFNSYFEKGKSYYYRYNKDQYYSLDIENDKQNINADEDQNNQLIARQNETILTKFFSFITKKFQLHLFKKTGLLALIKLNSNVCDIGFGNGKNLSIIEKNTSNIYGFEPNHIKYARAKSTLINNKNIYCANFSTSLLSMTKMDLVLLIHVLEHIEQPELFLKQIYKVISKDGYLFISLPNFESFQRRLTGSYWFHSFAPLHLHQFSEDSLEKLLEKIGFKKVNNNVIDHRDSILGWVQSFYNLLFKSPNALFRIIQNIKTNNIGNAKFIIIALHLILSPVVLIASLSSYLIELISGNYSTINLLFKKE